MPDLRKAAVNGINLAYREQGSGPLVLLCHGWPETSYSWRHQTKVLATAGYRVIVPDMRGYGLSDVPPDVQDYTVFHIIGDLVALVASLGESRAILVGHDWGATVTWTA